jgi:hypothetical protein
MKIDTLVLSGGSTKVPAYMGIFKALYSCNILNDKLQGIKHIITCSVGTLVALFLLLKVPLDIIETVIEGAIFSNMIDIENININDLIFNLGLFDNHLVSSLIKGVLTEKYSREDMTLLELYELNPIKLTVKCANSTKGCIEYISYENEPTISILTLVNMTTAIPLFFKHIKYKDSLYVDGGMTGGYPVEIVKDNYLGFNIKCEKKECKHELYDLLPIVGHFISLLGVKCIDYDITPSVNTINIITDVHCTSFDISLTKKKELIKIGYDTTVEHIKKYKLTNDLLN